MTLGTQCDGILLRATEGTPAVPGVVAAVTDRNRNIYEGVAGRRRIDGADMTSDTVFALFSASKAVAATAALQCLEEGLLDLDAPARTYVPELGEIRVIDGFDATGEPILRAPKREITTRHLMLHTAGFSYAAFNETYLKLTERTGPVDPCSMAALRTPLVFDPGEAWEYGTNLDWAGQVVEAIRGKRLGEVLRERVFDPLEMTDIGFARTAAMKERTAIIHARLPDGGLLPLDEFFLPDCPEVDMAGHGLYATVPEYMKFIRMWLNDGAGPNGAVLKPETVQWATANGLEAHQSVKMLSGVVPAQSNDFEFFPGVAKSWSFMGIRMEEPVAGSRPAGAVGWAGLTNVYFWIDRQNGIGGMWATQMFPFADVASLPAFYAFEAAAYSQR